MKYYYVDLTPLPPQQREKEADRLDTFSRFCFKQYDGKELVGVRLCWKRESDFTSYGVVPLNCPVYPVL